MKRLFTLFIILIFLSTALFPGTRAIPGKTYEKPKPKDNLDVILMAREEAGLRSNNLVWGSAGCLSSGGFLMSLYLMEEHIESAYACLVPIGLSALATGMVYGLSSGYSSYAERDLGDLTEQQKTKYINTVAGEISKNRALAFGIGSLMPYLALLAAAMPFYSMIIFFGLLSL